MYQTVSQARLDVSNQEAVFHLHRLYSDKVFQGLKEPDTITCVRFRGEGVQKLNHFKYFVSCLKIGQVKYHLPTQRRLTPQLFSFFFLFLLMNQQHCDVLFSPCHFMVVNPNFKTFENVKGLWEVVTDNLIAN